MKNIGHTEKGFTLIEILLYFSMISIMVIAMAGFVYTVYVSRIKSHTVAEVEQQGEQTMQIILNSIRLGTAINAPIIGSNGTSASLNVYDSLKSPTLFDLNSGVIRMKEGSGGYENITSNKVNVTALTFQNLSETSAPGNMKVSFTLEYKNPGSRNEYQYIKTFSGSASLKW